MTAYDMIEDRVEIPDAPSIPGLSFRRFRGETDLMDDAVVELELSATFVKAEISTNQ